MALTLLFYCLYSGIFCRRTFPFSGNEWNSLITPVPWQGGDGKQGWRTDYLEPARKNLTGKRERPLLNGGALSECISNERLSRQKRTGRQKMPVNPAFSGDRRGGQWKRRWRNGSCKRVGYRHRLLSEWTETHAAPHSAVTMRPPREVQATTRQRRGAEGARMFVRRTDISSSFIIKNRLKQEYKKVQNLHFSYVCILEIINLK